MASENSLAEVGGDSVLYLENPHDFMELAQHMKRIAHEPELRKRLKANGLKRADMFSWRKCAEQTRKAFS